MGSLCAATAPTRPDASNFFFWDSVHQSKVAYSCLFKHLHRTLPLQPLVIVAERGTVHSIVDVGQEVASLLGRQDDA
ncbi:hypothetical protein NL676_036967 [Syzygium grande]|nr:hypothetical protein NL676_036967 [Syzygium grande]